MSTNKMGRPTDSPRNIQLRLRLNHEENNKLSICCEKSGMNKTEVFIQGLNKVYEEYKDK